MHCNVLFLLVPLYISAVFCESPPICLTSDWKLGLCMDIVYCDKIYNDVKNRNINKQTIKKMKLNLCGIIYGKLAICCQPSDVTIEVNVFRNISIPTEQTKNLVSTSSPSSRLVLDKNDNSQFNYMNNLHLLPKAMFINTEYGQCGQDTDYREGSFEHQSIISNLFDSPWMALIWYRDSDNETFNRSHILCNGVLINLKYVLTAAHCIPDEIKILIARLSEYNFKTERDCDKVLRHFCTSGPEDIPIQEIVIHENFRRTDPSRHHDLALLRLKTSTTYTGFVKPICLSIYDNNLRSEIVREMTVVGWGRKFAPDDPRDGFKVEMKLPIYDQKLCAMKFRQNNIYLSPRHICAGGNPRFYNCTEDSGGPLMRLSKSYGVWILEGFISIDFICGNADWPAVYTNVTEYVGWILQNIRE